MGRHYFSLLPPNGAGVLTRTIGTRFGVPVPPNYTFSDVVHDMKSRPYLISKYKSTKRFGEGCKGCTIYHFEPCTCCGTIFLLPGKLKHLAINDEFEVIEICNDCPYWGTNSSKEIKPRSKANHTALDESSSDISEYSDEKPSGKYFGSVYTTAEGLNNPLQLNCYWNAKDENIIAILNSEDDYILKRMYKKRRLVRYEKYFTERSKYYDKSWWK